MIMGILLFTEISYYKCLSNGRGPESDLRILVDELNENGRNFKIVSRTKYTSN